MVQMHPFLIIKLLILALQPSAEAMDPVHPAAWQQTTEELAAPSGITMVNDGTVIITEPSLHRLTFINANGTVSHSWGIPGGNPGELHRPSGIDVSSDGVIAVADTGNHRIQLFTEDGGLLQTIPQPLGTDDRFTAPADVDINQNRLAIADTGNNQVVILNRNGTKEWMAVGGDGRKFDSPAGIALGPDGSVAVADTGNHRIVTFHADGTPRASWGDWGRFPSLFAEPSGVEWNGELIFVTDQLNHRVQVFTPDGELVTWWGMHAVLLRQGEGHIHYPQDIAISSDGMRTVVTEPFERRLQFFGPGEPSRPSRSATRAPRGLQSHFGSELEADGRGLVVWEPEVRSVAVFITDRTVPIHVSTFGVPGHGTGQFKDIMDMSWDAESGILTIIEPHRIQRWRITLPTLDALRYDPNAAVLLDSTPLPKLESGQPLHPDSVVRDDEGRLHLIDSNRDRLYTLSSTGELLKEWDSSMIPDPVAIGTDGQRLVVADGRSGRIFLLDNDGNLLKVMGPAPGITHPWPGGVALLDDGSIIISDTHADRLDRYSAAGEHLGTISEPGSDYGQLWMPGEVTQDALGRIVVLDHGNHRMQSFVPNGDWVLTFGLGRSMTPDRLPRSTDP